MLRLVQVSKSLKANRQYSTFGKRLFVEIFRSFRIANLTISK
jgi:hypothetical protein